MRPTPLDRTRRGSFLALRAARQALQQTASRAQDRGVAGFQIAMPALGAADKEFTRQQCVATRGDGFGPVAGGAGVGGGGRNSHRQIEGRTDA